MTPAALLEERHLALMGGLMIIACVGAVFMQNALGGCFSTVVGHADKSRLSAWM